jgi:hypothetical protein
MIMKPDYPRSNSVDEGEPRGITPPTFLSRVASVPFEVWLKTSSGGVIFGQQGGPPYSSDASLIPGSFLGTVALAGCAGRANPAGQPRPAEVLSLACELETSPFDAQQSH